MRIIHRGQITTFSTVASGERPSDSWQISVFTASRFLLWGPYANCRDGWAARIQIASAQGMISLISTYFPAEGIMAWVEKRQGTVSPVFFGALASYLVISVLVLG